MSLEQLKLHLNRQEVPCGDGYQPEGGAETDKQQVKRTRPPKRLGEYKLLKPVRRAAALNEKDANALAATKTLTQSNSQSPPTCILRRMFGIQIWVPREKSGKIFWFRCAQRLPWTVKVPGHRGDLIKSEVFVMCFAGRTPQCINRH